MTQQNTMSTNSQLLTDNTFKTVVLKPSKAKQGCQVCMMNGGKHFPFTKNCELSTPSGKTKHGSLISSSTPNWKKEKKKGMVEKNGTFPFLLITFMQQNYSMQA